MQILSLSFFIQPKMLATEYNIFACHRYVSPLSRSYNSFMCFHAKYLKSIASQINWTRNGILGDGSLSPQILSFSLSLFALDTSSIVCHHETKFIFRFSMTINKRHNYYANSRFHSPPMNPLVTQAPLLNSRFRDENKKKNNIQTILTERYW